MDFVKNLANKAGSSSNNETANTNNAQAAPTTNTNTSGQEDYLDKGLDSAEKKFGGAWGQDTQSHRAMNEKITDGARNFFEKNTGKDIPDKFSN